MTAPTPSPIQYVLGFVFTPDGQRVLLFRKAHPPWMAGKLTGCDGYVLAEGETPRDGMARTFHAKTGCWIFTDHWVAGPLVHRIGQRGALIYREGDWEMHVFAAWSAIPSTATAEAADALWVPTATLPDTVLPNLHWLIPFCLDPQMPDIQMAVRYTRVRR